MLKKVKGGVWFSTGEVEGEGVEQKRKKRGDRGGGE